MVRKSPDALLAALLPTMAWPRVAGAANPQPPTQ